MGNNKVLKGGVVGNDTLNEKLSVHKIVLI